MGHGDRRGAGTGGLTGCVLAACLLAAMALPAPARAQPAADLLPPARAQPAADLLPPARAQPAADLLQQRAALLARGVGSPLGPRLWLASREQDDAVSGDVHAELPQPFDRLLALFRSGPALCEMLLLHLNVRGCRAAGGGPQSGPDRIVLLVGPKQVDAASLLHRVDYAARLDTATPGWLRLSLLAAKGPMGTRDQRIVVDAVALPEGGSFVRLTYAYAFGVLGKAAMQVYLSTAGRDKIGFSVEPGSDGRLQPVRGVRGALERNVMRYHLALLAHGQVDGPPGGERTQARLRRWFELTEQHAAQLHEEPLEVYLREKRDDLVRAVPDLR